MEKDNLQKSKFWAFWTTLPGVLTSLAALIGAIGGLYLTFKNNDDENGRPDPNPVSTETSTTVADNKADTTFDPIEFSKDTRGDWQHVGNGDRNMHTSDNDVVRPVCETELTITPDKSSIRLRIRFSVAETVGDKTKFEGTKDYTVYTAPVSMKIVGIKAPGSLIRRFSARSIGENHDTNSFENIGHSYFKGLNYQIDSRADNDTQHVGVVFELAAEAILVARK